MILNNFAAIILKRKELKPLFRIFIKQYQEEIAFIEQTLKEDAEEIKREATCCYCMFRWMSCFRRQMSAKFQMCNPEFYRVFSAMGAVKRQEYFIQLLNYIQLLGDAYHQYSQKKEKQAQPTINQYKTHISTVLIEKFISKNAINELQMEEQQQICLSLLVVIDGIKSQKVGRFKKNFKFQLIEKKNGIQQKIVINLRNYLIVSYSVDTLTINVSAIYQTIRPLDVEISFTLHHSDKRFEKYVRIFTEITKLGKIQKLIRNIDLVKVFGKDFNEQADKMEGKNSNLLKSFVKQQQDMEYFHQKNYVDSQDIIRNTVNTQKRVKRLQTIKHDQYTYIKQRLIETLNVLAEKKQRQNEKVKAFLKKPAISRPKQKSSAIQRVLKSTQAFIPRKVSVENRLSIDDMPRELFKFITNFENQDQKLSIINRYNEQVKSKSGREKHDSFFMDNNEYLSHIDQKFNRLFRHSQSHVVKKVEYNRNIYNKLYPENFKFARMESLMEMIHVEFKQFYLMPEEDVAKQSNNLTGDKLVKFKLNWLDKLIKSVRVFCRKQSPNFIKISIPLAIEIRSLVQAMVNVEAYPLWHPNIKNVEIISSISTENAIIYRMQVINPITKKPYTLMMLMHLFRLEGKYYIIQKSIQDLKKENNNRGVLSFFRSKKSSNSFSKINFLMMRISNTNKNGICEMTISLDYQPVNEKMANNARMEQITFFVNYIFIVNFWKLSAEKKGLNMGIFNYDWMVSMNSFEEQNRVSMKEQEPDIFDDAKVEISRLVEHGEQKENVESSSQLIHSSEFYDV